MLIAIIADIHDNLSNLTKCLNWCAKNRVKKIICLGDLASLETAGYTATHFRGDIFLVAGNAETYQATQLERYPNILYRGDYGQEKISDLSIGFCHEKYKTEELLRTNANFDFIFYGHSHKPWLEKINCVIVANPGNLAGIFHAATFATLDTSTRELKLIILSEI